MRVKCVDNWFYEHLLKINEIYEVIRETSESYIIMVDRVGYVSVSKDKFVIEEDKMEEIRVVRKLEDLHNLENGMGLKIEWDRNLNTIDVNFGKIKMMYWSDRDLKNFGLELVLEQVKSLGFKFEYKPLRTEQEVKKEILNLESLPFTQEKVNYYVDYNNLINKYLVICDSVNGHGLHIYMPEGLAQKYADELNEIIKSK